jgi:prepilin-type processing-associated H-X9-DG protein
MPTPFDPRKKPTSVKVHVSNGAGVDIVWADGHASHYDFPYLRDECPCATCNDAREKKAGLGEAGSALNPSSVLPMYKPKARAQSATVVGNYAIQLSFNDGHSTGIYSYDHLRNICPCAECAKAFRHATG